MTATIAEPTSSAAPRLRVLAVRLAFVAGGLGLCANALFVEQPLGLNAPVFALLLLIALLALATLERIRPAWRNVWLAAPLMYFAGMAAVRAEPLVTFLNLSAAIGLALLLIYLFTSGRLLTFNLWDYVSAGAAASVETSLLQPVNALWAAGAQAARPGGVSARLWAIARGLVLAVPIILIFTMLLTSADAAFNQATLDALKFWGLDNVAEIITRLMVTGVAAWLSLGALTYALRDANVRQNPLAAARPASLPLGLTETGIVLLSVNLLFAAFVVTQFRYFFGGQSNITVAGYTYADYARRGFAELVIVALFTLGLGLAAQTFTRRTTATAHWVFAALCGMLVALAGIILASGFQRLMLYEEAYGFTRLRTYPHIFMIWVGVLLAVFLLTVLVNRPRLFVFGLFLSALGFIVTLNTLNTDAFIARHNIARYQHTGELDALYLATLSDDAVTELLPLLNQPDEETRAIIGGALHYRLNELDALNAAAEWPGWHWARAQAYAALQARRAALEAYEPQQYFWRVPLD